MTRDQDYTRDRLVECRGPATVDDGDEVTFVYQRPDGSQYDRQMVFRLLDAGRLTDKLRLSVAGSADCDGCPLIGTADCPNRARLLTD